MKVLIVNASPRTNMNTAQILKEVQRGAESAGHQTGSLPCHVLCRLLQCLRWYGRCRCIRHYERTRRLLPS